MIGMQDVAGKWRRVYRASRAEPRGSEIVALLKAPDVRSELIKAADAGVAPVSALAPFLTGRFQPDLLAQHSVRRFIGLVCSAVLAEEGFEVAQTVRLRENPIFVTGAVFRRVPAPASNATDVLERMLMSLTKEEKHRALKLLQADLEQLHNHERPHHDHISERGS